MRERICLDTGIINLNYSKDPPEKIIDLFRKIRKGDLEVYVLSTVLIEVFNILCRSDGRLFAENSLANFKKIYPIKIINLTEDLIIKSGNLKCQYRRKLSYIDCMSIAYSLNQKIVFYTTEKELPMIKSLKVKKFEF